MIKQSSIKDIEVNPLLKVPNIAQIIRRAIWWKTAEESLESYSWHYLFCRILARGHKEDKESMIEICGRDVAKEALRHAPPGEFFRDDWEYWNRRFGIVPIPAPPKRFPDVPDRPVGWGPWT